MKGDFPLDDIGGIVDHHCLNVLFIILYNEAFCVNVTLCP